MFDTIDQISKNKYINNLVQEAGSFGMFGTYVNYMTAENPANNGIYFICGYRKDVVMDKNANIEQLYEKQGQSETFRTDLYITKITNQSPFNVHQRVMNYCLHASTLRALQNKYNYNKELKYVSTSFLKFLEVFYLNSTSGKLSFTEQRRNEIVLQEYLKSQGDKEFLLNGQTGDGPEVHMRPEKLDKKCPNMLSMDDLTYRTFKTSRMVIRTDMLQTIKNELNKRRYIKYFQAKPVIAKLKVPDNQGFGSKEANTLGSIMFLFDSQYDKEMDLVYIKAAYPHCFRYSLDDVKAVGGGTCSFGVSLQDMGVVFENAQSRNIPLCLDVKKLYFSPDNQYSPNNVAGFTVTISTRHKELMDNVLVDLAIQSRDARILTFMDEKNYSYNPDPKDVVKHVADDYGR